jgi:hypothetical protein
LPQADYRALPRAVNPLPSMNREHAMSNNVKPFARRLRHGQFLHFEHPRQLCLRAERGSLWITIDGEPDDIELDAGQSRIFDGRSMVLVGSLGGDAVLSATPLPRKPPVRAWLARLQAWLPGAPRPAFFA